NRRFCDMLGYSEEELLGLTLADVTAEEFRVSNEADRKRVVEGAAEWVSEEIQYVRKEGDRLWCRATLSLVRVQSGSEQYLAAIVEDVSDRKRVEEERRQLAAAIEQAAEAVVITDAQGIARYVNPAWEQLSGMSRADTLGADMWAVLRGDHAQAALRELWDAVSSGRTWTGRMRIDRADGRASIEEVTASPVRDAAGEIVNFVAVARDITGQLALEERLRQAQKLEAIGTLAGGIAHDFNNILSAIMGYTDIAMCDLPEDSEVRQSLAQVELASRRAKDLVAQILAFSRQREREMLPVRVQSIVKEALKLLRGSIPPTIEMREEIDNKCAPVLADPTGIHQIVMNLCTNAYHAMQEKGGVLALRLSQVEVGESEVERDPDLVPGTYARLEVHDTGHGMDDETQARIFEPYFTTKERGEGTGLGLATLHGIVTDLNGVVHVYSEPGEGSTFTVLLPCMPFEGVAAEAEAPAEALRGSERVLLVDDEQPIGEFARAALERLGYSVVVHTSGVEALEVFAQSPSAFDVIVTDQMMPHMRGTELSRKIHAVRPDVPVILCSGFAETMRETAGDKGAIQCHVMKPIIGADLARAIRRVVGPA
ncbi:MAG: PAS domain S-box protein, partial [Candidatus Hydrogenedentes bacterium]|nr:PAS domain S-box protein [Candidatus Hydrogenedentota bacterium]